MVIMIVITNHIYLEYQVILENALHRFEQVSVKWQRMLDESLAVFYEFLTFRNAFVLLQGAD